MKKILVIGANGFLGLHLMDLNNKIKTQDKEFTLIASDLEKSHLRTEAPFYRIDITDSKNLIKIFHEVEPDVTILTASMTDVDQCEINKQLATKINVEGTNNVIKACEQVDSKLVFMSTDFVFDGTKEGGMYKETDAPNPLNHYATTKYKAELLILNSELNYLICRTAVLYGWNSWKLNFITWILNQLKNDNQLSIVTDQINSPTYIENLAEIILKLVEKKATGIYHTAGDCALSRYEMALEIVETFNHNPKLIQPTSNLKQKALRPKNVSLNISKLKSLMRSEVEILNLSQGLRRMKQIKKNHLF